MKKISKITKIIYILITLLTLAIIISNSTYAISLPSNLSQIYTGSDTTVSNIGGQIIWVAEVIMYAAAVIILIFAGVKYMYASAEGKAEIKKKMIYLVTGAIFLFAAGAIVQIIGNLALNNIK